MTTRPDIYIRCGCCAAFDLDSSPAFLGWNVFLDDSCDVWEPRPDALPDDAIEEEL